MVHRVTPFVLVVMVAAASFVLACNSGASGAKKTVTATAGSAGDVTVIATGVGGTETPSASGDIHNTDILNSDPVKALLASTEGAGQIVPAEIQYADVNGDGIDEAIIPISSGGTLGDIGFIVMTATADGPKALLTEYPQNAPGGLAVSIEGDKIVMTQPVPAPDDPNCCPSLVRETTYSWNGKALAIEDVETLPNPAGGGKGTPAATSPVTGKTTPTDAPTSSDTAPASAPTAAQTPRAISTPAVLPNN